MKTGSGVVRASVAVGLAFAAAPVLAQDVFNLPAGTPSPTARPAGPVDPQAPVVRPQPDPTTKPQKSAAPTATPATKAAPRAAPSRAASPPIKGPTRTPAATRAAGQQAEVTSPSAAATPTVQPATASEAPVTAASAPAPAQAERPSDWIAFAAGTLFGALVLLAAVGRLIWRPRQSRRKDPVDFEPAVVAVVDPVADAAPAVTAPEPEIAPDPPVAPAGLHITLEARRLDASLVAATLVYQLTLTNHGKVPLSALAIEGDMIGAHGSLPVEQQIANAQQRLELRHALVELAAGESAQFKGEMRLPLAAITPIRAGNAAYFVPLARLRVEAAETGNKAVVLAQTFVIGELPEQPGGALRPFRLDLGPRTFGKLGQRTVI